MSRRPLAPDLWEQALINGRRIHPGDDGAAVGWATGWYEAQGGQFDGGRPPAPADLSHLSEEQFVELAPQGEHATGDFEPEAEPAAIEEAKQPEKAPAQTSKRRRRAHRETGHFRADDPATPAVNEAWDGGDAA